MFVRVILQVQECIPVGCVPSAAVAVSWGGVCRGCVSARGGVCLLPGVHLSPCGQTDTCENITFLQLLYGNQEDIKKMLNILIYSVFTKRNNKP